MLIDGQLAAAELLLLRQLLSSLLDRVEALKSQCALLLPGSSQSCPGSASAM